MSFDKPLPPQIFGEEPNYVALRLDQPDLRAPLSSQGLAAVAAFPGKWTWMTTAEVVAKSMSDGGGVDYNAKIKELVAQVMSQRAMGLYVADSLSHLAQELRSGVTGAKHET